jgi:hypothetical protein
MAKKFGEDMKDKLIKMVQSMGKDDAIASVQQKLLESISSYRNIAPNTAKKELNMLLLEIEKETNQENFFKEILQNI